MSVTNIGNTLLNSNNNYNKKHFINKNKNKVNPLFIITIGPTGCGKSRARELVISNFNLNIQEDDIIEFSIDNVIEANKDYRNFISLIFELYNDEIFIKKIIRKNIHSKDWDKFFYFLKNYNFFLNQEGRMDSKNYKDFNKLKLINNPILKMFIADCNLIYFGIRGTRNENPSDTKNPDKDKAPDFDILGQNEGSYNLKFLNYFSENNKIQEQIKNYLIKNLNKKYKKPQNNKKYKKISNRKYGELPYYKNDHFFDEAVKKGKNVILESTGDIYEKNGTLIPSLRWLLEKYGKRMIKQKYHIILTVPFVPSIEDIRRRNISRFLEKYAKFNKNTKKNVPPRFPIVDNKMNCNVKRIYDNFRKTVKYFERRINEKKCNTVSENLKFCFNRSIFGKDYEGIHFSFMLFYSKWGENKVVIFDNNNINNIMKIFRKQYSKEIPFFNENFVCQQRLENPKLCLTKNRKTRKKKIICHKKSKRFFGGTKK